MKAIYFKNLLISLLILAAWTAMTLFIGSKSQSPLDYGITLFGGLWVLRLGALCGAGIVILLRIIQRINRQTNFFYFFLAISNFVLGVFGSILFIINESNQLILHELLPNLLIGTILLVDIFFFNALFNKSDHAGDD